MLYTISHGMHDWYHSMGILFMLLIIAVVIPCTLSDVVVPAYFAHTGCKKFMKDIHLKDISKTFEGERILDSINLIVPSGKFLHF